MSDDPRRHLPGHTFVGIPPIPDRTVDLVKDPVSGDIQYVPVDPPTPPGLRLTEEVEAEVAWLKGLSLIPEYAGIRPAAGSFVTPSEYRVHAESLVDTLSAENARLRGEVEEMIRRMEAGTLHLPWCDTLPDTPVGTLGMSCCCPPTRLVGAERARTTEALALARRAGTALAAACSLLRASPKTAAPSDKMFDQMVDDYEAVVEAVRAALDAQGGR